MSYAGCPFCAIASGADTDAREVYRDEAAVAFLPPEPATLGHTLVVPRVHVPDIWTLPEEVAAHLSRVTVRLATAIKGAVHPEGLNVIQSNGQVATQTVRHLHVHVLPRWENDSVGPIWPHQTNFSEQQKDDVWKRITAESRRVQR